MKIIFYCVNVLLIIVGLLMILFTSFMWLGSKENYEQIISNSLVIYLCCRVLINLFVVLIIILFYYLSNLGFSKIKKNWQTNNLKRIALIQFILLNIVSLIFIGLSLM